MRVTVYLLLAIPALLAIVGARLARHLSPAAAVRGLAGIAVLAGAATVWALLVLAVGGLGRTGELIGYARPHQAALLATDPVPPLVGILAAGLLLAGLVRAAVVLARRQRDVRALAAVRALPAAGQLVVVAGDHPDAYALPGRPGRIVVSAGMLRALPADERAVLLAHEHAHLAHHHHRYTAVAEAVTALNPALRPLRTRLAFHVERWADEESAVAVGSRTVAARSLARAALAGAGRPAGPAGALAVAKLGVGDRVRALQEARPISRWSAAGPAIALIAATAVAWLDVAASMARLADLFHV